ncbi:MAG: NADH dehydrogenase (quinone) subunit D [Nitrospirota bacterium]
MIINMGPQHPATHGLLRLVVEIDGETVTNVEPIIGYLHTGIEKTAEQLTYQQAVTVTDRLDYLTPLGNNLAYALAVEKIMGLDIPLRAQYARVILAELSRIGSHLVWLAAQGLDVGIISLFFYCFRDRETILDIFELCAGVRMMTSYINIGGIRQDLPEGFKELVRAFIDSFPSKIDEYEKMITKNVIWRERTEGVGKLSLDDAIAHGLTGPCLRAMGLKWDIRKSNPYSSYDHFEFDIPTYKNGDVFDRYLVRIEEMRQSLKIIEQAIKRLPGGHYRSIDRKISPPPKEELGKSMESLIHHFLISSSGFPVEKGEAYSYTESPRGALGFYVVSDGGNKPYRMRLRAPSFANLQSLNLMAKGGLIADLVAIIGSIDPVLGEIDR